MLRKIADILFGAEIVQAEDKQDLLAMSVCVILLEAAWTDQEFTDAERQHILGVMQGRFELSREDAEHLVYKAMEVHTSSTSLFRFTSRLNDAFTQDEKIAIMAEVWRIIYSDGVLNSHEDHLAHQLQKLLNLNHKQLIAAKLVALEEHKKRQA